MKEEKEKIKWYEDGIKAFRENNINGQWDKEIAEFKVKLEGLKKRVKE